MEWDFQLLSQELKGKQEELQVCHTGIIDAVHALQEEADALSDKWKGGAEEHFLAAFSQAMDKADASIEKIGILIAEYSRIEERFEACEKSVSEIISALK